MKSIRTALAALTAATALLAAAPIASANEQEGDCSIAYNFAGCQKHAVYNSPPGSGYFHIGDAEVSSAHYWGDWSINDCLNWFNATFGGSAHLANIYGTTGSYRIANLQVHAVWVVAPLGYAHGCRYSVNSQGGDTSNGPSSTIQIEARW
jgi:hypothetical protein